MSAESSGAVFLSYASQDAEAAQRICEALRAAGVEVWFDRIQLVGGDAWDQKIRRQIKECALFVPVISAATQARTEGYFRLEWRLADQRTHLMAKGRPFLMPVVIDDTRDADAHVPDSFTEVQWTRLPGGETSSALCERVKKLLGGDLGPRASSLTSGGRAGGTPAVPGKQRRWLAPAIAGVAALLALASWQPWKNGTLPEAKASAPLTEARKFLAQARVLLDDGDDLNRENVFLAEDLLKKAHTLDATDAEIWAAQAEVSDRMWSMSYDRSSARRETLQRQAERALRLAPGSVDAQLAYALYLSWSDGSALDEAVKRLRELSDRAPTHRRVLYALGLNLLRAGRVEEGAAACDRTNALPGGDARALAAKAMQMFWLARYEEAEAAVKGALDVRAIGRAQVLDVMLKLCWRGDLEGAAAAVDRWPVWLKLEPRGAFVASQVWLWRGEPDKAVAAVRDVASDAWNDTFFVGPKAALLALAHEKAGRREAAIAEWENTKRIATRMLAEDPALKRALALKGCAMARLGETAAAAAIFRELEQTRELRSDFWSSAASSALLRIALGHGGSVAANFDRDAPVEFQKIRGPVFDSIRDTPEFQKWMAAAPAPKTKVASEVAPVTDAKSIAVLAFANVGGDPANEYFSDGISEELLNVLAKIPELR